MFKIVWHFLKNSISLAKSRTFDKKQIFKLKTSHFDRNFHLNIQYYEWRFWNTRYFAPNIWNIWYFTRNQSPFNQLTCITDQWTRLQWQKSLLRNSWTKNYNNRHSPWILDKNWSRMTFRKHPQCLGCHLNVLYALIYGKYGTFFMFHIVFLELFSFKILCDDLLP